ncbi:MAG: TGS domain-containing protein, partial [Armatimonadetes bacterium]|nr:TGS domain-containing protein [Armatimonadota bacterium]
LDLLDQARIDLVRDDARAAAAAPPDETAGDGGRRVARRALLVANKLDAPNAAGNLEVVEDLYGKRFTILPVSASMETGLDELRAQMFRLLHVIRVYTKAPGQKPNLNTPLIMRRGGTLLDAAREIHKDFAHNLKFARLWGARVYDGLMVPREHVLEDGDVLEFHL